MRGKFFVITLLVFMLVGTVSLMVRFVDQPMFTTIRNIAADITTPNATPQKRSITNFTQKEWETAAGEANYFTRVEQNQIQIKTIHRMPDLSQTGTSWESLFIKGFNLGAALPGCFPSEFKATELQYYEWLEQMGDLESNSIRTYTILPPEFYQALKSYNFNNNDKPIYLIQGVWAYVLEEGSYGDSTYIENFHAEIRDVIDVIHGNAVIDPRPGHASGVYTADVSRYTAALILGREWEPNTVSDMRWQFPEWTSYQGVFFSVPDGQPMECWIAETLDYAARYETAKYKFQHALSFVNWLPLDPMYHDGEWIEWDEVREFDNDLETIDPGNIHDSPLFKPGYFASYHAYPYYPDFVSNDIKYQTAECSHGQCNYYGYLQDLIAAHEGMPVVIAEFGVPSSRSSSHFEPGGMNQGGHSELEQGNINAHLIRDIHESGAAGAILFAWIDEWFKHNWLLMDFELPRERNKLWHNLEDPEQNFGIVAMESGSITIDGNDSDWPDSAAITNDPSGDADGGSADIVSFRVTSDAACLYLCVNLSEKVTGSDWEDHAIWIGIDTYSSEKGDHYFPGKSFPAPSGLEFVVEIGGPEDSRLLVDDPYDLYTDYFQMEIPGYASESNNNGIFNEQHLLANRMRETLLGEVHPEILLTRSNLLWGTADLQTPGHSSLTDISQSEDGKQIELRIPWSLINVTDPSSRSVLDNKPESDELDIVTTEEFRFYPMLIRDSEGDKQLVDTIPDEFRKGITYSWETWNTPEYSSRLKEGAHIVADAFRSIHGFTTLPTEFSAQPQATITQWPDGKPEGVSVTFDDGSSYQYRYGKKLLEKYGMRGTFFVVTSWIGHSPLITGETDGLITRRLSINEIRELQRAGHEIGSHGHEHRPVNSTVTDQWIETTFSESQTLISEWTGEPAVSVGYPYSSQTSAGVRIMETLGFKYGRIGGNKSNDPHDYSEAALYSHVMIDDMNPDPQSFVTILDDNLSKWTVLQYHHLFPKDAREYALLADHDVEEKYNVTPRNFERQMRLLRNRDLSVLPISEMGEYLRTHSSTSLEFTEHQESYVLTLIVDESAYADPPPLTLQLSSPWEWMSITGSLNDGVYHNRAGQVNFNAIPGSEVIVQKLNRKKDD